MRTRTDLDLGEDEILVSVWMVCILDRVLDSLHVLPHSTAGASFYLTARQAAESRHGEHRNGSDSDKAGRNSAHCLGVYNYGKAE